MSGTFPFNKDLHSSKEAWELLQDVIEQVRQYSNELAEQEAQYDLLSMSNNEIAQALYQRMKKHKQKDTGYQ